MCTVGSPEKKVVTGLHFFLGIFFVEKKLCILVLKLVGFSRHRRFPLKVSLQLLRKIDSEFICLAKIGCEISVSSQQYIDLMVSFIGDVRSFGFVSKAASIMRL